MASKKQLFLLDAHALCYRSFYAIRGLANSKGQMTNAVYGFVSTLKKILKEYDPRYMAACFDSRAMTHRQQRYAEYKIQRQPMPDDLRPQMDIVKEVISGFRIPVLAVDGYEADDLIASLAETFAGDSLQVVIVSDDKDMFQLVNDNIKILSPKKDRILDARDVEELMGVKPERITDFMALAGDKTDNIPGVPGIGIVTARKLIGQYGDIPSLLKKLQDIEPPKLRDKIASQQELVQLSQDLAALDRQAPIACTLEQMFVGDPDYEQLLEIYTECEFKRLAEECAGLAGGQKEQVKILLADKDGCPRILQAARETRQVAVLVTSDQEQGFSEFRGIVIATSETELWQVPEPLLPGLQDLFAARDISKLSVNVKDLITYLAHNGCELHGELFDVQLAAYLLSPVRGSFDLKVLAWQYLKMSLSPGQGAMLQALLRLRIPLLEELEKAELLNLFQDIEMPLARVLSFMEQEGVHVDEAFLQQLSQDVEKSCSSLRRELFEMAGEEFNLNSPKQLSHVLFDKLKLPVLKRTKTGYSTNEEVLVRLAERHPLPARLLEYRQLAKLQSTYIDALPKLIDPDTHRIHASFNQTGTETGRLSSSNPNLQNIPIRTDLGRQIRRAFIPADQESCLLAADYSQIELRILAHLSGDEQLQAAFAEEQDIHALTAARIFDVEEKDVDVQMRIMAKRVNFGIIYGMSAFGLAKDLHISQGEAAVFIDKYFLKYPRVKDFMAEQIRFCEEHGYVTTLLNRRRYLPDICSDNMGVRQFAQRQAINTPVQGSAADLIKLAMIRIYDESVKRRLGSKMIITVHDELVFDVRQPELQEMIILVREQMEQALTLSVPVRVTMKVGPNWLDAERVSC